MKKRKEQGHQPKTTFVFVHYFGGYAESWRWMAKSLEKRYRCVFLNLPGFGKTDAMPRTSIYDFAKYINARIEALQLEDYILCGHSMGGKLVLYAAKLMVSNPPRHLVLIAPSPPTTEAMEVAERQRMLRHPNRAEALKTVQRATHKRLGKKKLHLAVRSQLLVDPATWTWWLNEGMQHDIADRISDLDVAATVIYAKADPVIPEKHIYERVLPYLNRPAMVAMGKCGHLIPLEKPKKLARQLMRIAKRQEKRTVPIAP
ncbi:alpha/beta fold hydrolase [Maribacter sp. 2307ULW6-5]|uniref:alpha/beta fold hydrolase n=1 Tax=Maribacter sp. 2307ULW6-5 TaxID=3386275 RepID=UPI0039BCEE68